MAIDLTTEPALRPAQAAKLIPPSRGGKATHPATIARWIVAGCPLSDGTRLRLEAVRLPSGWVTTPEALRRFVEAITADRAGRPARGLRADATAPGGRHAGDVDRELQRCGFLREPGESFAGSRARLADTH